MTHCENCGIEVNPDASFCSGCGAELAERETTPEDTPDSETAACVKCDSQISVDADRCPNCGHEPGSHGILVTLIVMLALGGISLLFLLILFTWVAVALSSISIMNGVGLTAIFGVLTLPAAVILYLSTLGMRKTPTGDKKSWREIWDDA